MGQDYWVELLGDVEPVTVDGFSVIETEIEEE